MENSATAKCLDVAERILSALDDKSIYQRYLTAKTNLNSNSSSLSPGLKSINHINEALTKSIQDERNRKTNSSISSYIIQELHSIQMRILPNTADLQHNTVEESISSLLSVIDTKVTSHQFLKQKLTKENQRLKEAISQIKEVSMNDIQEGRKKRISNDESWSQRRIRLIELEKAAQNEKQKLRQQIEKTKKENGDLMVEITQMNLKTNERKELIQEAEAQVDVISDNISQLTEEANKLKYELQIAKNSDVSLANIQKYKSSTSNLNIEKKRLLDEIEKLKKRNNMLNAQINLKNKR